MTTPGRPPRGPKPTAPKRKTRAAKTPSKAGRRAKYEFGAIPDDTFGSATDIPPPRSPEAPPLAQDQRFEYLLDNPDLYKAAAALPPPSDTGRPAHHPPVIYLIFLCSISLFGSARSTACHLQRRLWWDMVRRSVHTHMGDAVADTLKPTGPSRSNWNHYFHKILKPVYEDIRDTSRDLWIQQALDHGMMEAAGKRNSRVNPERHQVLHGDATVASPPSSQTEHETADETTGKIRRHRVDEDAGITVEGGDKLVYGNKFLSIGVRLADTPHSRVIMALESIRHRSVKDDPDRDAEGTAFVKMVKHILTRAPGLRAATYDTALRGVHRAPLIAEGLLVFTPQHSGLPPQSLQRYEKGPCTHDLYVAEARVCLRRITVDGQTHYTPLPVEELEYREGKRTRFYHRVTIPCAVSTHTVRIRVDETEEDRQIDPTTGRRRFNRTERLRQIPPDTPAGRRLKGFRQDSESTHSRFDQCYPHKRVPVYGATAGLLVYIGFAWLNNSVTRARTGLITTP
ncbi:hypothetical protein [Streptomyces sp. NPDC091212]|uniref:hypothetical protein n=1 Tax=Streptomyces sp. NPDC091212 TaxID=3155191 RepID=UPI003438A408